MLMRFDPDEMQGPITVIENGKRTTTTRAALSKRVKKRKDFDGEQWIREQLVEMGFSKEPNGFRRYDEQFHYSKERDFRADFRVNYYTVSLGMKRALLEYDGGIFAKSRTGHSTGMGIINDMERSNLAQIEGYCFLRFTEKLLKKPGYFESTVKRALGII